MSEYERAHRKQRVDKGDEDGWECESGVKKSARKRARGGGGVREGAPDLRFNSVNLSFSLNKTRRCKVLFVFATNIHQVSIIPTNHCTPNGGGRGVKEFGASKALEQA